jgi:GNAT superfamily N-acetyltransferase
VNAPGVSTLREMIVADIPLGMRLKALAGWNQTAADWRLLLDAGRGWVAAVDGVEVGTATLVTYGAAFSWIGMVLVDPAYRRRGIGTALLHTAIAAARARGVPRLDATPQGAPLYAGLGFRAEYGIQRMLRPSGAPELLRDRTDRQPSALTPDRLQRVVRYDAPVFGADRRRVLAALRRRASDSAFLWIEDEMVRGYVLARDGSHADQIGPLVAETADIARALLVAALGARSDRPVVVDVLADHPGWIASLAELGFRVQRPFTRMAYGVGPSPGDPKRQFAIAGPELG